MAVPQTQGNSHHRRVQVCLQYVQICITFFSNRNIARRAFDDVATWSRICKVPEEYLRDYGFLLKALRCGYAVNPDAYQALADDWLFRWHADGRVYWSGLTPSCHIVLVCFYTYEKKIHKNYKQRAAAKR